MSLVLPRDGSENFRLASCTWPYRHVVERPSGPCLSHHLLMLTCYLLECNSNSRCRRPCTQICHRNPEAQSYSLFGMLDPESTVDMAALMYQCDRVAESG